MTSTSSPATPVPAAAATPLLRHRGFRSLYVAGAVSGLGSQVSQVALPLLAVTALGAGPGEVGLLSALGTLTVLLLGLPAGVWVDRSRRRSLMILTDVARAAVLLSVPVAWWMGWLGMGQLYAVAVLMGAGTMVFDLAAVSVLPGLVGRDRLMAANSLLVGTQAGMDVTGKSLGGVLVQAMGAPVALLLDALSHLWSAAWLRHVPEPAPPDRPATGEGVGRQIAEGVRFLLGNTVLVALCVMGAMANLAFPLLSVLLPVLLVRQLGHPEWVLGAYLAAGGLGTLAGSATAHLFGRRLGAGRTTLLLSLATAPPAFVIPFLDRGPWLWAAAGAWFVLTFRTGVNNVLLVSVRQRIIPDGMLGRANATIRLVLIGAVGLGGLLAGVLGEVWGVRASLWAGAVIMALSWLPVVLSPLRRQR
ncbi:MFS transporter [Nonomuraea sp. NPDC005501]|uniref:MFS transporter n=1 Tax=Nonomuraea sp. NPDC005501 TaxID=3156884 RepID=UPI0033BC911B